MATEITLDNDCFMTYLTSDIVNNSKPFSCNHEDLDDFFKNDCEKYTNHLLGKSYCFCLKNDPETIVAAFTVSNDSIKTSFLPNKNRNRVSKKVPQSKRMKAYPAVLIGRLGVNKDMASNGLGTQVMNFIKAWFVHNANKTGCRFIVVDAYNNDRTLKYYTDNNFVYMFDNEEEEMNFNDVNQKLNTRLMYFDLIKIKTTN